MKSITLPAKGDGKFCKQGLVMANSFSGKKKKKVESFEPDQARWNQLV